MTENLTEALAAYGIDYADAIDRFDGNADLYKRMALKYENDDHMVALKAAMEMRDYDEGYRQAHALKGVAGNLSFTKLYEAAAFVSDALNAGESAAAEAHMPIVEAAQEKVLEGLEVLRAS